MDPNCQLCGGTGLLEPEQSAGISHSGPCLCVHAQQAEEKREADREYWKALVKEAVLEAFHTVAEEE